MDDAKDRRSCRPRKQSVWFVRYGLTEHPLVEDLGPYDSDIDPTEGIDHAVSIAKRVAAGVGGGDDDDDDGSVPGVVYSSPFLRTTRTGYIIANELEERRRKRRPSTATTTAAAVELRLEEGLWEWLIPSLLVTKSDGIRTHPRLPEELRGLLEGSGGDDDDDPRAVAAGVVATGYDSVNPYDDSGDDGTICAPPRPASLPAARGAAGAPRWTETEDRLLERCATTLSGLLKAHETDGGSFCVVSHAPCDQAMAFFLEKEASSGAVATPSDSTLAPWPLGGITVFSRPIVYGDDGDGDDEKKIAGFGSWTMELYGDTDHMPGAYKAGLKEWSLPCFSSSG